MPDLLKQELRLSVARNAAGYAMFCGDGRDVIETDRGPTITLTEEETLLAQKVAERVLHDIDTHDGRL